MAPGFGAGGGMHTADRPSRGTGRAVAADLSAKRPKPPLKKILPEIWELVKPRWVLLAISFVLMVINRLAGLVLIAGSVLTGSHQPGTSGRGLLVSLLFAAAVISWLVWVARPSNDQGVKKLIEEVKKELTEATDDMEKKHETALFRLKSFDLEVTFVAQTSTTNSAGATYELVTVNNQLASSSGRTQKLNLHMEVVPPEHKKDKLIAGPMQDGSAEIVTAGTTPPKKHVKKE